MSNYTTSLDRVLQILNTTIAIKKNINKFRGSKIDVIHILDWLIITALAGLALAAVIKCMRSCGVNVPKWMLPALVCFVSQMG